MLKNQSYPEIAVKDISPLRACIWPVAHLQVWSFNLQRLSAADVARVWLIRACWEISQTKGVWVDEQNEDLNSAQVFKFPLEKEDIVWVE